MRARVCLVTTGQPSTNPRLVKEADALTEAGHAVHVIGAEWADWATEHDQRLLTSRPWSCHILRWHRGSRPYLFWKSGVRRRLARHLATLPGVGNAFLSAAVSRVTPELAAAASAYPADLYVAHNLGALPAAAAAAARHRARLGFDAEDFHSGEIPHEDASGDRELARRVEEKYVPQCRYVTAASPGIAARYAPLCAGGPPTVVLNVFPLADRPAGQKRFVEGVTRRLYWFSQTIGPGRGLEDVVAAMGETWDLPLELHLRGVWQPGFEKTLRSLAAECGLRQEQVVWHRPALAGEMVRLAATFDVGLALEPGSTDNSDLLLSNKIFTYLLAGLPVVATATSGQAALAAHLGAAAVTAPPRDRTALAGALRTLVSSDASFEVARRAAWALGESRYNWDREKRTYLAAVSSALARVPTRAAGAAQLAS